MSDPALVIEDDTIAWVGEYDRRPDPSHVTIDLRDKFAIPGMIDSHVHLEFAAATTHEKVRRDWEEDCTRDSLRDRASRNAQRMLHAGVTAAQDCGSSIGVFELRDDIAAGRTVGPTIISCGPPITSLGGHMYWMGVEVGDVEAAAQAVTTAFTAGADAIKVMVSGGFLTPETNPFAPQFPTEVLRAIVTVAHELGMRVVAHALDTESIRRCAVSGVDAIDHCLFYGSDGGQDLSEEVLSLVKGSGATVGLSAAGSLRRILDSPEGRRRIRDALAPHRAASRASIPVLIHSDAGAHLTTFGDFSQSLSVAQEALGCDAISVLSAVTSRASRALGLEQRLGMLAPGMRADIVLTDQDPTLDVAHLTAVCEVIVRGRPTSGLIAVGD